MRPPTFDPTAGERARAIHVDPGAAQLILDPTDPRSGDVGVDRTWRIAAARIVDPTDPQCGHLTTEV